MLKPLAILLASLAALGLLAFTVTAWILDRALRQLRP